MVQCALATQNGHIHLGLGCAVLAGPELCQHELDGEMWSAGPPLYDADGPSPGWGQVLKGSSVSRKGRLFWSKTVLSSHRGAIARVEEPPFALPWSSTEEAQVQLQRDDRTEGGIH